MADRIYVLYQPVLTVERSLHLSSLPTVQEAVLQKFDLERGNYIFYVGAVEPRKNVARLVRAHLINNNKYSMKLVISGHGDDRYIKSEGLEPIFFDRPDADGCFRLEGRHASEGRHGEQQKVIYTGGVSEIEKLCLLRNARAFVFPSLTEGFGIPPLEAQALGCPVISSNKGGLNEVVQDSVCLIEDPFNLEDIADCLVRVCTDDAYADDLIRRGYDNIKRFNKSDFSCRVSQLIQSV